jgi:hypothetical protein
MSAMGQSEKSSRPTGKSALPSKTDIVRSGRHVSKVPGTDIGDAFETTRQALEFRVDEREKC